MTTFMPSSQADVLDAVKWALSEDAPLEIVGHGSKRGIGRPMQCEHTLDLSSLSGVTLYEPEELVLSAKAGTPLAEIEGLLAEHRQEMAFEPMDCTPLFGGTATQTGKTARSAACSPPISPARAGIKAGAARDHVLGINAVSGRGEAFKSGGRVVKNVTGYDLSKLMAGSWGTLAVVTDVTFKVLPAAETADDAGHPRPDRRARGRRHGAGDGLQRRGFGARRICRMASRRASPSGMLGDEAATLLRVEGFGPSVAYRIETLKRLLENAGPHGGNRRAVLEAALARHPRLQALRRRHRQARSGACPWRRRRRTGWCWRCAWRPASTPSTTGRAAWSGCAWRPSRKPRRCAG